ncbi:hypothetical protein [Lacisediminihabitans sp. H27-G8]|uniref:hypothetical protein n=1 Tax=Lacisediminihabitans sp. H27-G8 TaxID=3111909 RepID=UPI0038FCA142
MDTPHDPGVDETDGPDSGHRRPAGMTDAEVEALGKLSEALETVENARGLLYGFHRLTGKADLALGEAVEMLRRAGHTDIADEIDRTVVGRNVIEGRWTFQIVEGYDDGYYREFRSVEAKARALLAGGRRHLYEAEMKEDRRTHGLRHHEARPDSPHGSDRATAEGQ